MNFLYIKAVHIIFVVTWFAGLFYMVRLFIYSTEANEKAEPERSILSKQLLTMQQRLWYIITWPSAIVTLICGAWLAYLSQFYWSQPWFKFKLFFVFGLYVYHYLCHLIHKQMTKGNFKYSSVQLRIWNEVSTLFLFAIVFLVVVKSALSWVYGIVGLISLGVVMMLAIKIYKRLRND